MSHTKCYKIKVTMKSQWSRRALTGMRDFVFSSFEMNLDLGVEAIMKLVVVVGVWVLATHPSGVLVVASLNRRAFFGGVENPRFSSSSKIKFLWFWVFFTVGFSLGLASSFFVVSLEIEVETSLSASFLIKISSFLFLLFFASSEVP